MDALPQSTRRPSRWPWILACLLSLGLAGSLLGNLVLGIALAGASTEEVRGFTPRLVDGKADTKEFIAIIPIQGMIIEPPSDNPGKGSYGELDALLRQLDKKEDLKGLLLVIDSPGGGVTASDRMYDALRRFKKRKNIPVVAIFEDVAASGGYYVAMAADHIIAHPTSVTGSIGVIARFYNVQELAEKVGFKVNVVKSLNDKGKESFKDMGSPFREMRPEERALMQGLITEMWERFTSVVTAGREGKMTREDIRRLADGRVFTGEQARKLKLVDEVGYTPEAYATIRERCGNKDAKIMRFVPEKSWQDLFSANAEKIAPKLELPPARIMYLWDPR